MAIRKVIPIPTKKTPVKKTTSNKASLKKASTAKGKARKKPIPEKPKAASPKCAAKKRPSRVAKAEKKPTVFDSERMAERVELVGDRKSSVSVETLKIGLLLAAIDGTCDRNEIKKFKTVAKSCGNLSDAKIAQIITQMQKRVSVLEDAAKHGASDDELVDKFMEEARKIGVRSECRDFVLWMSIAMVDGDYSGIERKAIAALQQYANRHRALLLFARSSKHEISDMFLKRCQMILSGIYKADSAGEKRLMENRMKSLQTLIEIAEA